MNDSTRDVVRRLAAFGALTRATGFDDVVVIDGDEITHDDGGGNWIRLRKDGDRLTVWGFDRDDCDSEVDRTVLATHFGPHSEYGTGTNHVCFLGEEVPANDPARPRPVVENWQSDETAELELADWFEQYLVDAGSDEEIDRELLKAIVNNPFSPANGLRQLVNDVDATKTPNVETFLAEMWRWLGAESIT
ncbi:hypothetical protein GOEFS_080_00130 [Gordonia effusa NBRC 100432]|uniref:Uncharacterized protein n=1 Tax=Gordonia effusa NBRC 100432 TaxID=1077974 RepID=H0R2K0_9ACTN|nr:hypothetical protein [Gordonia effusa]GAB19301.1 hypothetical protein GOEFS_080_00130 [Gordonia effusa NBRC 100432]